MIEIFSLLLLPLVGAINSGSFPDVLEQDKELELINLMKLGDLNARNELIEHNLRLVAHIVKKFENTKEDKDDLLSIGAFGLIKAVDSFKLDSGVKLATYASRCIENEILMYLRKTQKQRQVVSLDEVLSIDAEGNEMMLFDVLGDNTPSNLSKLLECEDVENLYKALNKLKKREREIIVLRFGLEGCEELTQKEVADKLGISQSYISRLEKRIIDKMRQDIINMVKVS